MFWVFPVVPPSGLYVCANTPGESLARFTVQFLSFSYMYRKSWWKFKQTNLDPKSTTCQSTGLDVFSVRLWATSAQAPAVRDSALSWFSCSQCCRAGFCLNSNSPAANSRLLTLFLSLESELSLSCAPSYFSPSSLRTESSWSCCCTFIINTHANIWSLFCSAWARSCSAHFCKKEKENLIFG